MTYILLFKLTFKLSLKIDYLLIFEYYYMPYWLSTFLYYQSYTVIYIQWISAATGRQ